MPILERKKVKSIPRRGSMIKTVESSLQQALDKSIKIILRSTHNCWLTKNTKILNKLKWLSNSCKLKRRVCRNAWVNFKVTNKNWRMHIRKRLASIPTNGHVYLTVTKSYNYWERVAFRRSTKPMIWKKTNLLPSKKLRLRNRR